MATKFSPCKGSYVLNQFPSNVMFSMNGFHLSASGAIQGHHGPLVLKAPGSVFTNHSQEHSLSLSPTFANWNVTRILIGLANQNLCYIQKPLTVEKSGE